MPIPKSPEEIVKEFDSLVMSGVDPTRIHKHLESALASFALYLEGKMEVKKNFVCEKDCCPCESENTESDWEFDRGLKEAQAVLRHEAEEVMKGV